MNAVVAKRWRIGKHMLVPAQWNGSVQHFYHFFFGYLMPVRIAQERLRLTEFAVRDCGPMNPWFDLLPQGTELEFMSPGVMLQRVLTNRQEHTILHGWDDPTRFHRASLRRFSDAILDRVGATRSSANLSTPHIVLIERRKTPDFFLSAESEVFSSGTDFRSLPAIDSLGAALGRLGTVTTVDAAELAPAEQVRLFSTADLLVAQHGAGLSNMVFQPRGASVVEIKPPLQPTIGATYMNLASAMSLGYIEVAQEHDHAGVEVERVVSAAQSVLSGPQVPRMTGSLPIRLLRQLPRRL